MIKTKKRNMIFRKDKMFLYEFRKVFKEMVDSHIKHFSYCNSKEARKIIAKVFQENLEENYARFQQESKVVDVYSFIKFKIDLKG